MERNQCDIKENTLHSLNPKILTYLLRDKTTQKNIIWATDNYTMLGPGFNFSDEISVDLITGNNGNVIRPRVEKTKDEQCCRSKEKGEVFTPSWVCNKQNNSIDASWFGRHNAFNVETQSGWNTIKENVVFPQTKGKTWQDYVKANRLEVSCGEAPYLTSRYDTVSGDWIPVKDRIGLLDRKLRVVSENTNTVENWTIWAVKAVQSVYGFDWQGDNVLLARENVLWSFAEHYEEKFGFSPDTRLLIKIAKITAWNIWQMDGIKFVVPNSCHTTEDNQISLTEENVVLHECPGCKQCDHGYHNGTYCRIYDWSANRSVEFYSLIKKGETRNGSKV